MNKNVSLVAFGTFGAPNGFTQTVFLGNPILQKSIKTFDIRGQLIIYPKSNIYSIRKEFKENLNIISYSKYTYAQEPTSARTGSFIGSSIIYTNKIADEHITINQLNEFHNQLIIKNVKNETLLVNHSDKLSVAKPKDFDKIDFNFREIEDLKFTQNTDKTLVVFCSTSDNHLIDFCEKAIDLLNVYDTIYFTESREIAEFINQKGIFKLIQNVGNKKDFDKEIIDLIEERKRKREQSISAFEREIQAINENKNKTIQEFKAQIDQSERIHLENDHKIKESKEDIQKIILFYDDFLNKTNSLISKLKHNNSKLEEVKQLHNNNKILFNNGLSELKRPHYTTKPILKPKPKGNLHIENQHPAYENKIGRRKRDEREESNDKVYKINKYKVTTLILVFLLTATWVYLISIKSNSKSETEVSQQHIHENKNQQSQKEVIQQQNKLEDLQPKSNSMLSIGDYTNVAKNLKYGMELGEVVKVIFIKNPTDISSTYSGKEEIYSKHLLEQNKQCFEERDGLYYFTKDTIKHIPSFKK